MIDTQPSKLPVNWRPGDLLVFIIPCLIFIEVKLVGRLFLSEIIILVLFPFLFRKIRRILRTGPPKTLFVLGLLWLLSQVGTDLIRSSPFANLVRGWSNIGIFLLEFAVIYSLVAGRKRRVVLFAIGICTGQVLQYFIAPNIYAAGGETWKFGVGYATTFFLVLATQLRSVSRFVFMREAILFISGIINFVMGARSLGGLCLIAGLYLFIQGKIRLHRKISVKNNHSKNFTLLVLLIALAATVLQLYGFAADKGFFGASAQEKYQAQSSGNFGILLGGRQEIIVSSLAIIDSPIIGHGSWAENPEYIALLPVLLSQFGYDDVRPIANDDEFKDLIPTHSYIFGAWVNAGLLGAIFWSWVMIFCAKLLFAMIKSNDSLTPVVAFVCFNMLWNILFSPFGAETRFYTAFYLVLVFLMHGRLLLQADSVVSRVSRYSKKT